MNKLICLLLPFLLFACKNEETEQQENESFFPVLSFLKSQATQVDTSLYQIMKIEKTGAQADTSFIKREEFKIYARDFLSIPDITNKDLKDDYTETRLFDQALERVLLSYTPKKPDAEIRREDITIQPTETGDKVKTIFIDRYMVNDDSTVHKKMLWQVDKRFQIVTSISRPKQPEQIKTVEIVWNDFPSAE